MWSSFVGILRTVVEAINTVVGSYGWSIVIFTVLIRLVMMPLDIKSKRSMKKTQALQPQLDALKVKYANDQQKLAQKQSELYKKERINPLSGCLPVLLQMPILFAMLAVFREIASDETIKLIHSIQAGNPAVLEGWLWIKNVWQPDSLFATIIPRAADLNGLSHTSFVTQEIIDAAKGFLASDAYKPILDAFGASPFYSFPLLIFGTFTVPMQFNGLFLLPIIACVSQVFASKLMTATTTSSTAAPAANQAAGTQKMMTYIFPIMSLWICSTSNAGFSIYWVASNLIQIVSTYMVNKYIDYSEAKAKAAKPEEDLKK